MSAIKSIITTKKAKPVYQFVLIGETGSGKTSFLNLICNFDLVCDLGLEKGLDVLRNFHDLDIENAQSKAMESKTSEAICYKVHFGELEVGIIDTPGFGDSRGMEEDKKNVKKIVDTIEKVEYINCICLVINGRQARASLQLKYVLTEISATLPKTAFQNLIVILTNCGDVTDANFDVRELHSYFDAEVQIKPERVFYIENPYCKLEKCRKEKKLSSHDQKVHALKFAFQRAGDTMTNMLVQIQDFNEVHTNCFVQLYNAKEDVEKNMIYLLTAQQNKETLEKQIAIEKEKIDVAISTKTLNEGFTATFKVMKVVTVPTTGHNTICKAPHCNSNCHVPCTLSKTLDKENLKACGCIDQNNYLCKVCGHSYRDHYHAEMTFQIVEEVHVTTDEKRKEKFEAAISEQERGAAMKAKLDLKLKQCEKSMDDKKVNLITTLEMFQKLGSSPSYEKVLECQLYVIDQRIAAQQRGDDLKVLHATRDDLNTKLILVKQTVKEPWTGSKSTKIKWAQTLLQVQPSANKEEIEKAYKTLAKIMHPDKSGGRNEDFQNLSHAKSILLQELKQ